jgi:hypothetical protein
LPFYALFSCTLHTNTYEQEQQLQELEAARVAQARTFSLEVWRLTTGVMRKGAADRAKAAQEAAAAAAAKRLEDESAAAARAAVADDVQALALAEAAARDQRAAMRDALVNHKREVRAHYSVCVYLKAVPV